MNRQKIKWAANAFAVWRAIKMMDGDVSIPEIAEETGIQVETVRSICHRKGWRVSSGRRGPFKNRPAVDVLISGALPGHD